MRTPSTYRLSWMSSPCPTHSLTLEHAMGLRVSSWMCPSTEQSLGLTMAVSPGSISCQLCSPTVSTSPNMEWIHWPQISTSTSSLGWSSIPWPDHLPLLMLLSTWHLRVVICALFVLKLHFWLSHFFSEVKRSQLLGSKLEENHSELILWSPYSFFTILG
jgi:hypothetical protein